MPESKAQPNHVHCDGAGEANLSGRKRTVAVTLSLADGASPAPGSSNASGENSAANRDRGVAGVYVGDESDRAASLPTAAPWEAFRRGDAMADTTAGARARA